MQLRGKKVTVIGLARSGVGAANLLTKMGAEVTVTDSKSEAELINPVKRLQPQVRLALGGHPERVFVSADMVVISPGVPPGIRPVSYAKANGIPVLGELELAYRIIEDLNPAAKKGIPFLAITGSNGKSTTTTLLNYMMTKAGFKTILGGNIGNALTEEILKTIGGQSPEDFPMTLNRQLSTVNCIVVEVSSFQLETIDRFRPRIAAILNITPDHMDRYHSLAEYAGAKTRIFENQGADDFLILNADDPETKKIESEKLKVKSIYFSRGKEVEGIYSKDGFIYSGILDSELRTKHLKLIRTDEIRIKGVHNLENAMAASAMALLAGCPQQAVIDALREFEGLEHRLEFVRELDGVRYINDSKGTNVGAVIKSIESFQGPLVLIAGGRDKAGDFSALRGPVTKRVKALVLIGEASEKIKCALGDITDTVPAEDLQEAVALARSKAKPGDAVLLSPACASFDMFLDFEDRGRQFKKMVMELDK